jgi:hypothetical protein
MNGVLNSLQLECLFRASPEHSESTKLKSYSSVAHAVSSYVKRKGFLVSRSDFITVVDNIAQFLEIDCD